MDTVELPYLPSYTTLRFSLDTMRLVGKSAVIRDTEGSLDLLKAADVFRGLSHQVSRFSLKEHLAGDSFWLLGQQVSTLGDLKSKNPAFRLSIHDVQKWNLDPVNPQITPDKYEHFLDSVGASYAVLSSTPVSCVVVTRHEHQKGAVDSGPRDCYCLGPDEHEFPPPSKSSKDPCDRCSYEVHCEY